MTRFGRVLTLVMCATGCVAAARSAALPAAPRTIVLEIRDFAFRAPDTTAAVGDTVVWINRDALAHTTTADSGAWTSPELPAGGRFAFVPRRVGRYTYHCAAHPVMRGALAVRD
jgi:plastocyanin